MPTLPCASTGTAFCSVAFWDILGFTHGSVARAGRCFCIDGAVTVLARVTCPNQAMGTIIVTITGRPREHYARGGWRTHSSGWWMGRVRKMLGVGGSGGSVFHSAAYSGRW